MRDLHVGFVKDRQWRRVSHDFALSLIVSGPNKPSSTRRLMKVTDELLWHGRRVPRTSCLLWRQD